jgi:hypothetical protein
MIRNVDLVHSNGLMAESTLDSGVMVSNMVKACISTDMVKKEEEHGTKASVSIGLTQAQGSKINKNQKTKNDY